MQNEILKPVLATDESAVPRYDIVSPTGSVLQQNVELRLKNEVMQEGTPYDEDSVLPAELATQLGLPATATPAQAFQKLATLAKSSSIGDMKDTVNTDLGDSWLLCNGDVVNRAEYPELYDVLERAGVTGYQNIDLEVTPAATKVAMGVANGIPWFTGCARALNSQYTINVKLVYFSVENASFHTVMLTYTATDRMFNSSVYAKVCFVGGEYMVAILPLGTNDINSVTDSRNTVTWYTKDLSGVWEAIYLAVPTNNTYECFYDLLPVGNYFVLTCAVMTTSTNTNLVMYAKAPNESAWTKYLVEPNANTSNGVNVIRYIVYSNGYFGLTARRYANGGAYNYWFYTPVGTTTFTQLQTQDSEGGRTDCNLGSVLAGDNFQLKVNADGSLFFAGMSTGQYGYGTIRYVQVADPTFGADTNGYVASIRTAFEQSSMMFNNQSMFPLEVNGMYVLLWHYYNSSGGSSTNNVSQISYKSMTDAPTVKFTTPSNRQFFPYGREFYDSCVYEDDNYYIFGTDSNNTLLTKYGADLANIASTATIANDVGRGGTSNVVKVGEFYYIVTTSGANDSRVKVHYTKKVGGTWTTESLPDTNGYGLRTSTLFNDGTNVIICTQMTANSVKFYKTFYRPLDGSADWQCVDNIIVQQAFERGGCYYYVLNGTTYENYVCSALGRTPSRLNDSTAALSFSDLSGAFAYQVDSTIPQLSVAESIVGYSKLPVVSHNDHYTYIKAKEGN